MFPFNGIKFKGLSFDEKEMESSQRNYTGLFCYFCKGILQQIPRLQYKYCFLPVEALLKLMIPIKVMIIFENNEDVILPFNNEKNSWIYNIP